MEGSPTSTEAANQPDTRQSSSSSHSAAAEGSAGARSSSRRPSHVHDSNPMPDRASRAAANSNGRLRLYSILGVDIKASPELIRQRYLTLARRWHPDRHKGCVSAKVKFQEIVAAFEVLSNADKRLQYDLGLVDLLDLEDYLNRFQGLILTPCGLGMRRQSNVGQDSDDFATSQEELAMTTAATSGRGGAAAGGGGGLAAGGVTTHRNNNNGTSTASMSGHQRRHSHGSGWLMTAV